MDRISASPANQTVHSFSCFKYHLQLLYCKPLHHELYIQTLKLPWRPPFRNHIVIVIVNNNINSTKSNNKTMRVCVLINYHNTGMHAMLYWMQTEHYHKLSHGCRAKLTSGCHKGQICNVFRHWFIRHLYYGNISKTKQNSYYRTLLESWLCWFRCRIHILPRHMCKYYYGLVFNCVTRPQLLSTVLVMSRVLNRLWRSQPVADNLCLLYWQHQSQASLYLLSCYKRLGKFNTII